MAFDSELCRGPDTFGRAKAFVASYVVRANTLNLSRSVRSVGLSCNPMSALVTALPLGQAFLPAPRSDFDVPRTWGRRPESIENARRLTLIRALSDVTRCAATAAVCSGSER
jgi:hypothetical protein